MIDGEASAAARWYDRPLPGILAIVLLTFLVYLPAVGGEFVWDDKMNVWDNDALRTSGALRRIWLEPSALPQYFPVTYSLFLLQYRLWGLWTPGYHLVNILLHASNAVLLLLLLRRLAIPGAWLAAALFAVHPVQVESVAWISELKNVLSGFFFLLTLLTWFRPAREEGPGGGGGIVPVLPLALFSLALLSKTSVIALPIVVLLITWWRGRPIGRREILFVAGAVAAIAVVGAVVLGREFVDVNRDFKPLSLPLFDRLLLSGRVFWFYAAKLVAPLQQAFIYPRWTIDRADWHWYLWTPAVLFLLALLWNRRVAWGRGPLAAVLFYGCNLAPFLGLVTFFFTRYSFVADHFQYLASMGPIVLGAAGAASLARRPAVSMRWGRLGVVAAMRLVSGFGGLAWRQAHMYRSEETVWRWTVERNPRASMAWNNLGNILLGRKEHEEAGRMYLRALTIEPDFPQARYNLGYILLLRGDAAGAVEQYRLLQRIHPGMAGDLGNFLDHALKSGRLRLPAPPARPPANGS